MCPPDSSLYCYMTPEPFSTYTPISRPRAKLGRIPDLGFIAKKPAVNSVVFYKKDIRENDTWR